MAITNQCPLYPEPSFFNPDTYLSASNAAHEKAQRAAEEGRAEESVEKIVLVDS